MPITSLSLKLESLNLGSSSYYVVNNGKLEKTGLLEFCFQKIKGGLNDFGLKFSDNSRLSLVQATYMNEIYSETKKGNARQQDIPLITRVAERLGLLSQSEKEMVESRPAEAYSTTSSIGTQFFGGILLKIKGEAKVDLDLYLRKLIIVKKNSNQWEYETIIAQTAMIAFGIISAVYFIKSHYDASFTPEFYYQSYLETNSTSDLKEAARGFSTKCEQWNSTCYEAGKMHDLLGDYNKSFNFYKKCADNSNIRCIDEIEKLNDSKKINITDTQIREIIATSINAWVDKALLLNASESREKKWLDLGFDLYEKKKFKCALYCFEQIAMKHPDIWYSIAAIHQELNDTSEASRSLIKGAENGCDSCMKYIQQSSVSDEFKAEVQKSYNNAKNSKK